MKYLTSRTIAVAASIVAVSAFAGSASASLNGQPLPLPTGSADSRVIKDGTIQPRDLSQVTKRYLGAVPKDAVTTVQIRDKSIRREDISPELWRLIVSARCGAK